MRAALSAWAVSGMWPRLAWRPLRALRWRRPSLRCATSHNGEAASDVVPETGTVTGTVEKVYRRVGNEWFVMARVRCQDTAASVFVAGVVGRVLPPVGSRVRLQGKYRTHGRYGRQFWISRVETLHAASSGGEPATGAVTAEGRGALGQYSGRGAERLDRRAPSDAGRGAATGAASGGERAGDDPHRWAGRGQDVYGGRHCGDVAAAVGGGAGGVGGPDRPRCQTHERHDGARGAGRRRGPDAAPIARIARGDALPTQRAASAGGRGHCGGRGVHDGCVSGGGAGAGPGDRLCGRPARQRRVFYRATVSGDRQPVTGCPAAPDGQVGDASAVRPAVCGATDHSDVGTDGGSFRGWRRFGGRPRRHRGVLGIGSVPGRWTGDGAAHCGQVRRADRQGVGCGGRAGVATRGGHRAEDRGKGRRVVEAARTAAGDGAVFAGIRCRPGHVFASVQRAGSQPAGAAEDAGRPVRADRRARHRVRHRRPHRAAHGRGCAECEPLCSRAAAHADAGGAERGAHLLAAGGGVSPAGGVAGRGAVARVATTRRGGHGGVAGAQCGSGAGVGGFVRQRVGAGGAAVADISAGGAVGDRDACARSTPRGDSAGAHSGSGGGAARRGAVHQFGGGGGEWRVAVRCAHRGAGDHAEHARRGGHARAERGAAAAAESGRGGGVSRGRPGRGGGVHRHHADGGFRERARAAGVSAPAGEQHRSAAGVGHHRAQGAGV
eukprot:ctg_1542.g500